MKNTIIYRAARKLYHLVINKDKKTYKPLNKKRFLKKISRYDVISFDIFDTLISRNIYNPDDIFLIVGQKLNIDNFLEKRKKAENEARNSLKKDVNLDEIYKYYNKLYNEDTKKIQSTEEELELLFCFPRMEMQEVINDLYKKEKTIILTSDMYLKKETIEKMLKKCGYNKFDIIYLSNEKNARKDTKEIWKTILHDYPNKKIIHIGDNYNSDYKYPRECGIKTIKIESGKELFQRLEMSNNINEYLKNNISNSILIGTIVNKYMFNSPFSTLTIDSLDTFASIFYGPIINEFLSFIDEQSKQEDMIIFLSREGYYLQKLYYDYCKLNNKKTQKNMYFLASRKATTTANMNSKKEVIESLDNDYNGTIKDFFKQIYDTDYEKENFEIKLPDDKEKILPIVEEYISKILSNTEYQKDNYLEYINQNIDNYQKKKIGIIDLGYSGTIQYQLSKMTNNNFSGYYLTNSKNVKKYFKTSKLQFLFDINNNSNFEKIYHYSLILEYFLSAPYGQLVRFENINSKITPIYNDDIMTNEKEQFTSIIYKNIKSYMEDVLAYSNIQYKPDKELICYIYTQIIESNLVSRKVKDYFDFTDYFCNNVTRNVFKIISRY